MPQISTYPAVSVPILSDYLLGNQVAGPTTARFLNDRLLGLTGTPPGGRLTTESGVPVSTSDRTAQTRLYYTPYVTDFIRLYDGTRIKNYAFSEVDSGVLVLTNAVNVDWFLYDNAGTLTLEKSADWTNDTTRADALAWQTGLGWVKSGTPTRLWVGTSRASGLNVIEDSGTKRFAWNTFNKVRRPLLRIEPTATWTYGTSNYRQANGSSANQVEVVVGAIDAFLDLCCNMSFALSTGSNNPAVAIGEDSTTVPDASCLMGGVQVINGEGQQITAYLKKYVPLGYHSYTWLEWVFISAGTVTFYGTDVALGDVVRRSGLLGAVDG